VTGSLRHSSAFQGTPPRAQQRRKVVRGARPGAAANCDASSPNHPVRRSERLAANPGVGWRYADPRLFLYTKAIEIVLGRNDARAMQHGAVAIGNLSDGFEPMTAEGA
jgi:hypothetical protein